MKEGSRGPQVILLSEVVIGNSQIRSDFFGFLLTIEPQLPQALLSLWTTRPCWDLSGAGLTELWSLRPGLALPESTLNTRGYEAAHLSQGPASLHVSGDQPQWLC